jgi:hypothetical protein
MGWCESDSISISSIKKQLNSRKRRIILREQLGIVYSIIFVPQHKTAEYGEKRNFNEAQSQRKSITEFFSLFYIFHNIFCNVYRWVPHLSVTTCNLHSLAAHCACVNDHIFPKNALKACECSCVSHRR